MSLQAKKMVLYVLMVVGVLCALLYPAVPGGAIVWYLSALLGLLAVFFVLLAAWWRCPHCERHLGRLDDQAFCPYCGKPLYTTENDNGGKVE